MKLRQLNSPSKCKDIKRAIVAINNTLNKVYELCKCIDAE